MGRVAPAAWFLRARHVSPCGQCLPRGRALMGRSSAAPLPAPPRAVPRRGGSPGARPLWGLVLIAAASQPARAAPVVVLEVVFLLDADEPQLSAAARVAASFTNADPRLNGSVTVAPTFLRLPRGAGPLASLLALCESPVAPRAGVVIGPPSSAGVALFGDLGALSALPVIA